MTESPASVRFGPFVLESPELRLRNGDAVLAVTHKALLLLHVLCARAGELVTKEELIAAVWPRTAISDAALSKRVQELRAALGDDPRAPLYIETVHRRGFRFLARVESTRAGPSLLGPIALVGRANPIAQLGAALASAARRERRLVLISGEAGIGKTRLLQCFLQGDTRGALIGQGQCVPQGEGQPYLPVLAALRELVASDAGGTVARSLRQHAPSWSTSLEGRADPDAAQAGATQQRMLFELATALEHAARERPVVISVEDLHWADPSTIALLDLVSRRTAPAGLLLIGTLRDAAFGADARVLREFLTGRLGRDGCVGIELGRLRAEDVRAYLEERFEPAAAAALAPSVFERTLGLPLFLNLIVQELLQRADPTERGAHQLPESLQRLFDVQLRALPGDLVALLEVASVLGAAFELEALAQVLGLSLDQAEQRVRAILGASFLLTRAGGPLERRFSLAHELLREALYARLSSARRREIHAACAAELERRDDVEPAALALHYREAGASEHAARQHLEAGRRAVARHAHQEAVRHFESAVSLLPEALGQSDLALDSLLAWGSSLVTTLGFAHPRVREIYGRAHALAQTSRDKEKRFAAVHGLRSFHFMRGRLQEAAAFEPELLEVMRQSEDPTIRARGHAQIGERLFFAGELAAARESLELACRLATPGSRDPLRYETWATVAVGAHGTLAQVEFEVGRSDTAQRRVERMLEATRQWPHPYSAGLANWNACLLQLARRDFAAARPLNRAVSELAGEYGFADLGVWAGIVRGYLATEDGELETGIALMQTGLAALDATGIVISRSGILIVLAGALARTGAIDEGLAVMDAADRQTDETGEDSRRPVLHAMRAQILAQDLARNEAQVRASLENSYRASLRCGSLIWELRASCALLGLADVLGVGRDEQRSRVANALARFSEGRDGVEQIEARALLAREVRV